MTACLTVLLLICGAPYASAVTLLQVEDFSDGVGGWSHGIENPNSPVARPNTGPSGFGDTSLEVVSSFGGGVGSRLVALNTSDDWTGDFSGQGISGLRLDLRNIGAIELFIRIALKGSGGGWAVTSGHEVNDGQDWANFFYDLAPAALTGISGADPQAILSDVVEMRILHNPSPTFRGASLTGGFRADNLTAVPEPSAALIAVAGSLSLLGRRASREGDSRAGFPVDTLKPAP